LRIIFLDFDGVLHPLEAGHDKAGFLCWLPLLESLLVNAPDVRLLVHSTWRYMYSDAELATLLGPLSERFLGSTPKVARELAVEMVLQANKGRVRSHLVLDDDCREFTSGRLNVLFCDSKTGISALNIQAEIASWLRNTAPTVRSPFGDRLPRGQGELLLYLDFDGVLHHENVLWHPRRGVYAGAPGFELFEHAALLAELLAPHPQVGIVLSTSWVRTLRYSRVVKRLPPDLRHRVLGATFHSQMDVQIFLAQPRGRQVLADVARRQPKDWFALDDTDEGWSPESRPHVLITDERLGVSAPGMPKRIADALRQMTGPSNWNIP